MRQKKMLCVLFLLVFAAPDRLFAAEDVLARGQQLYLENCAVCHGERGDGEGPEAYRLQHKPWNFQRGLYKFRSTPSGALPLDTDVFRTLSQGVPGTAMIPQTHLSTDERWAVIQYLKSFSKRFLTENPANPIPIPRVPVNLSALAAQGKQLYADAGCATCHGQQGRGSASEDLKDVWGRPMRPPDLTWRPFKSGSAPQDLYRLLVTGLNGTSMPSYQDALNEAQLWALIAYVDALVTPRRRRGQRGMGMMGTGEEHLGRMIEMRNRMRYRMRMREGGWRR